MNSCFYIRFHFFKKKYLQSLQNNRFLVSIGGATVAVQLVENSWYFMNIFC